MKFFLSLILSFGFIHFAKAAEAGKNVDMSKPPFWLSSFDEIHRLRKTQKAFYIGKLEPILSKVPSLKEFTSAKLQETIKDPDRWSDFRMKVFIYCADASVRKTCDSLAQIRLDAIDHDAITQIDHRPPVTPAAPAAVKSK